MPPPVDDYIYRDIIAACGKDFAFSYLAKAGQREKMIFPFTVVAFERLMESRSAREVFQRHGIWLQKPEPYHEGRRFMGDTEQVGLAA